MPVWCPLSKISVNYKNDTFFIKNKTCFSYADGKYILMELLTRRYYTIIEHLTVWSCELNLTKSNSG